MVLNIGKRKLEAGDRNLSPASNFLFPFIPFVERSRNEPIGSAP